VKGRRDVAVPILFILKRIHRNAVHARRAGIRGLGTNDGLEAGWSGLLRWVGEGIRGVVVTLPEPSVEVGVWRKGPMETAEVGVARGLAVALAAARRDSLGGRMP